MMARSVRRQPLAVTRSIKAKFAIVIVVAIAVATTTSQLWYTLGWPIWLRPVVAAVVSVVAVQFLAHGMTKPLRDMVRASKEIARGRYDMRVETPSVDEVGQLAEAFNLMAGELADVDRQRRELVATVSHELRTPIAGLRATLENLADGVVEPGPDVMQAMLGRTTRLQSLVEDLLDLSRLEAGIVPLRRDRLELSLLVAAALDECRHDFPDASITMNVADDVLVDADPDRLHQVVVNLVENAIRHGGGEVVVSSTTRPGSLDIMVSDNGPGLAPEERDAVFERFHRAVPRTSAGADGSGTGLGLAIVRWIALLHGGSVRAESNEPTGARFVVSLPAP